jgi:hypothetical protein
VYDDLTNVWRAQAEVIINHVNPNLHDIGEGEAILGSIRGLNLATVRPTTILLTSCSFRVIK